MQAIAWHDFLKLRFWLSDDALPQLTACPEPDSQGAAPRVSFAVLCPQVAKTRLRPIAVLGAVSARDGFWLCERSVAGWQT